MASLKKPSEILSLIDAFIIDEYTPNELAIQTEKAVDNLRKNAHISSDWNITSVKPVLGPLIIFVKRILRKLLRNYVAGIVGQQNAFNSQVVESQRMLFRYVKQIEDDTSALRGDCKCLQQELDHQKEAVKCLQQELDHQKEVVKYLQHELDHQKEVVKCLQHELDHQRNLTDVHVLPPTVNQFDYTLFEERFRGSREDITQRQSIYLDVFIGCENILDVGCGRGEFLALMAQNGISARGVDFSSENVALCRKYGLDVVKGDMFSYLEEVPNDSLGGVFCSQVIEHISVKELIRLLRLIWDKLKYGAPVVLETINPGNLISISTYFYMDVSHVRPVVPQTLQFLMESNGYMCQEPWYLHPNEAQQLPMIECPGAEAFNEKLVGLNQVLYGAQDYSIVAYKVEKTKR